MLLTIVTWGPPTFESFLLGGGSGDRQTDVEQQYTDPPA